MGGTSEKLSVGKASPLGHHAHPCADHSRLGSSKKEIGRLEIVPVRKVFSKEAPRFTAWLEAHIGVLAEPLGQQLTDK
jgi:hypothetical protein